MKKFLTLALCFAAVGSMSAQKASVEQAKKLSGKIDKIAEARELIVAAMSNPETANDVATYYTAGKIEFDAFDEAFKKRAINPNDPLVDSYEMGKQLINGYNLFLKALPLDSLPNEKGQIKPKHSKDMVGKINGHFADYYNYGGDMFNNKHYYPEAYNAFMIYGDITKQPWAAKEVKATPDSMVCLAYHYAGIGAFSGNELNDALKAFKKARLAGITDPKNYVYEIACWQNLAQRDSTLEIPAKNAIMEIARHGYENFGVSDPLFINNLVNSMVQDDKYDEAIALVSNQIDKTPDKAFLYGLRAYVYDRNKDEANALADYRKAADFEDANSETLRMAARRIYNSGVELLNTLEPGQSGKRQEIKDNYIIPAKTIAERAKALNPSDGSIDSLLENIDYALTTYF